MAQIGSWGSDLVFAVNSNSQLPFNDFKREIKARWATHNINLSQPRTEYQGIEQPSVDLTVTFSAHRGQSPKRYIDKLESACKAGELNYLFVGGKRIGDGKYYIESVSETWDEVWNQGELARATLELSFREYK